MFYILERPNNLFAGQVDSLEEAHAVHAKLSTTYPNRQFRVVDASNYTLKTDGDKIVAVPNTED